MCVELFFCACSHQTSFSHLLTYELMSEMRLCVDGPIYYPSLFCPKEAPFCNRPIEQCKYSHVVASAAVSTHAVTRSLSFDHYQYPECKGKGRMDPMDYCCQIFHHFTCTLPKICSKNVVARSSFLLDRKFENHL